MGHGETPDTTRPEKFATDFRGTEISLPLVLSITCAIGQFALKQGNATPPTLLYHD